MSDHFADQNNAKLSHSVDNLEYFEGELTDTVTLDEINSSYDHMYATNHEENGLTEDAPTTCQTTESEVNFFKDFLLIHLDLIQQQNDDIVNKESTIFILQEENARLREQIRCMESGLPYQSTSTLNNIKLETVSEDMTLDSGLTETENTDNVVQIPEADCQLNGPVLIAEEVDAIDTDNHTSNENNKNHSPVQIETDLPLKLENPEIFETNKVNNNTTVCDNSDFTAEIIETNFTNTSYTIHSNCLDSNDPMKNLKMSIRRKRLCSTSSAISNNDSLAEEKRNFRRSRKKRKRIVKNEQILTYDEQYVTQVGDQLLDVIRRQQLADEAARAAASTSNLEVPRWRVKVYTSCYTMEGTENLEDEAFLRRHNRLENDERRRKRWDVQRIREQRVIEKLKLRQDKIDSNNKGVVEQMECMETLWPLMDDIKYIEMFDLLPVSAFGCPVPKVPPCEFSLPWVTNPNFKKTSRRTTGRRRVSRR